ncbi:MAG: precorrin-3B synthase [Rhodobacteraceae bacterium]|nr:MAG: precorrin-3B synthase [Paracoccaceae bacterium]
MSTPIIQGRCPGAHRPMMSGDGLVVRVRPRLARLTRAQILGLCAAAQEFGSGMIDLTNRANLQLRGVAQSAHAPLLVALERLDLLDKDPATETRRNIIVSPFYQEGDLTARLATELTARLADLPDLPPKFGFCVDAGPDRLLAEISADIRLERGQDGGLILRADGVETGRSVDENTAIDHLIALAGWFADTMSPEARRMARVLQTRDLPAQWTGVRPVGQGAAAQPGQTPLGALIGAPFGQFPAQALADLITAGNARALRVTPWRLALLEGAQPTVAADFVTNPQDPILTTDACPGAPFCPQAQVETRTLARQLAPHVTGSLHVSGCAKSCARMGPASVTLVGRNGRFDLVKQGRVGDEPVKRDLTPQTLLRMTDI